MFDWWPNQSDKCVDAANASSLPYAVFTFID